MLIGKLSLSLVGSSEFDAVAFDVFTLSSFDAGHPVAQLRCDAATLLRYNTLIPTFLIRIVESYCLNRIV
jgi:hypothetical protein